MSDQEQQSGREAAGETEAASTSRRDFLRKSAAGVGAAVAATASARAFTADQVNVGLDQAADRFDGLGGEIAEFGGSVVDQ